MRNCPNGVRRVAVLITMLFLSAIMHRVADDALAWHVLALPSTR